METDLIRRERLRRHRLTAPAASVAETAAHMTATQAQEFWGGRWALAARTASHPTLREVDAAFAEPGGLVRSWTQRGTLHIVPSADLPWILSVTAERQRRQHAGIHRSVGIDADVLARAEAVTRAALAGGNRLTRSEFADVLTGAGIDATPPRGNHLFSALALRLALVLGPVVPRDGAPTRDQYVVAPEDWLGMPTQPADAEAELLVRYLRGHGPATLDDFGWWAGLPKRVTQRARDSAGDGAVEVAEGLFAESGPGPEEAQADAVRALPPFDEYYLSYRDRTVPCSPAVAARIGPTMNGMVRPILVADGAVVGTWSHSLAVGRHHLAPTADLFGEAGPVAEADVDVALTRYARFLAG